jgi:hypothetical protein
MDEYPTPLEFEELLYSQPLEKIVDERLFGGIPFAFRRRTRAEGALRRGLAEGLRISTEDMTIVGSGRLGFSLKPTTFGRKFSRRSDIDVVVVNANLFDTVWLSVLRWSYPYFFQGGPSHDWIARQRFDIYRGAFDFSKTRYLKDFATATFLKPLREASSRWFLAFQALNRDGDLRGLDIKGRLYRTWDFARYYHIENLRMIKEELARQKGPVTHEI